MDGEPKHRGLQYVVIVGRHGFNRESGDHFIELLCLLGCLAATAENGKGISVAAGQLDNDLGAWGI